MIIYESNIYLNVQKTNREKNNHCHKDKVSKMTHTILNAKKIFSWQTYILEHKNIRLKDLKYFSETCHKILATNMSDFHSK